MTTNRCEYLYVNFNIEGSKRLKLKVVPVGNPYVDRDFVSESVKRIILFPIDAEEVAEVVAEVAVDEEVADEEVVVAEDEVAVADDGYFISCFEREKKKKKS